MTDSVLNKIQSIQRCIGRAREEYEHGGEEFSSNYSRQDAAMLNVLRACETTIALSNHVIRRAQLGVPNSSRDGFKLLQAAGVIDADLAASLMRMVGFRNIVVHQYGDIDMGIVESVISTELDGLLAFTDVIRAYVKDK